MKSNPINVDKVQFSRRLHELRKVNDLSLRDVAVQLGISVGSLCSYEHGDAVPSLDKIYALAEIYHCNIDYLVGRCENKESTISTLKDLAELVLRLNDYGGIQLSKDGRNFKLEITESHLIDFFNAYLKLSTILKQQSDFATIDENAETRKMLFDALLSSLEGRKAYSKSVYERRKQNSSSRALKKAQKEANQSEDSLEAIGFSTISKEEPRSVAASMTEPKLDIAEPKLSIAIEVEKPREVACSMPREIGAETVGCAKIKKEEKSQAEET